MLTTTTLNPPSDRKAVEEEVNQDLELFNTWFQTQGNAPLAKSEWAILKTYCYFKIFVD